MHPSSAELIDFAEGRSRGTTRTTVQDHLRGACRRCRRRLELYRLLIGSLRNGPLTDAPYSLVEAAIGLFASGRASRLAPGQSTGLVPEPSARRRRLQPARGVVELLARLVFDSERDGMRLAPAVRSVGTERRLRFEGGGIELDVLLRPDPAGVRVIAQAIVVADDPTPLTNCRYVVRARGRTLAEGHCDAFGELRVDLLQSESVEIVLDHQGVPVRFDLPG